VRTDRPSADVYLLSGGRQGRTETIGVFANRGVEAAMTTPHRSGWCTLRDGAAFGTELTPTVHLPKRNLDAHAHSGGVRVVTLHVSEHGSCRDYVAAQPDTPSPKATTVLPESPSRKFRGVILNLPMFTAALSV
jgi:hypothetical protein